MSKDRPCQLQALLESAQMAFPAIVPYVLYKASTREFAEGYQLLSKRVGAIFVEEQDFRKDLLNILSVGVSGSCVVDPLLAFCVDDQIFRRRVWLKTVQAALKDPQTLCFSLRLGPQISYCYSMDCETPAPEFLLDVFGKESMYIRKWLWQGLPGDWGYPFSTDATVYRTASIMPVLQKHQWNSPNSLEASLARDPGWKSWPRMACGVDSFVMNVPMNLVNKDFPNRNVGGMSPELLNDQFLRGYVIDWQSLVKFPVESCHVPLTDYPLTLYVEN